MSKSLRCALGFHDYGDWQDINPCRQAISCKRCGYQREERVSHEAGEWKYERDGYCDQLQICLKCGAELGKRIEHEFVADWKIIESKIEHEFIAHYSSYYGQTSNEDDVTYEFNVRSGTCKRCRGSVLCEHPKELITVTWGHTEPICGHCGAEGRRIREVQRGGDGAYHP